MPIITYKASIGTASAIAVGQSPDAQQVVLENLAPLNDANEYAKAGYSYLLQREFTVASPGTAIFEVSTGTTGMQIEGYDIISTTDNIKASLLEGATVGTSGAAIPAYNLNRNESDAHNATFTAGTSISGGTVIAAEYITADKHAASGGMASGKIFTLVPSTDYAMTFVNKGNQTTTVFFQMRFSEKYNGWNDVYLGGEVGDTIRLRGGEKLTLKMLQGQTLSAVSNTDNELGVLRQD